MNNENQDIATEVHNLKAQLDVQRRERITSRVDALVQNCQVTALEAPKAVARAMTDESYLDELAMRGQILPGCAPLNFQVVGQDTHDTFKAILNHCYSGPQSVQNAAYRSQAAGAIYQKERLRILPVLNAAATNTIDAGLKRVLVLNETVRAFATRVLALRAFSTVFGNVPLQGTDEVVVPYYPLQAAASSNFTDGDGTGGTGYVFGQATNTQGIKVTVNKRKYQPLDFSSSEFRRQPWFDSLQLGAINAEKLGADIFTDIWSAVTAANFGAPVKTASAGSFASDDIVDIKNACTKSNWPAIGRSLIVESDVDSALQKDPSYKLALNIGTTSVIQEGTLRRISGFDYYEVPNLPTNGEKLLGAAVFKSAIAAAFAPVDPAPGVRAQLYAYEIATDPATGISMNFRHWGEPMHDRDYQVIESAYGYDKLVAAALKRICAP